MLAGASLVLAGGEVAVGQAWGDFTARGHVGIAAGIANRGPAMRTRTRSAARPT